jgi:CDP-diacylglycerol--serine O-phosphatidyltransferase
MKLVDAETDEPDEGRADPEETRRERRRRRRQERRRQLPTLLPSLLTTGNLAAGFYAILEATRGDVDRVAVAILFAMACDLFDGRLARRVGAESRFGAEYDSIADAVSFGVAPAVLAFHFGQLGAELGWTGWVLAFGYMVCAALRLARFNVSSGRFKNRFQGLPSPAAAGVVVTTAWFFHTLHQAGFETRVPAFFIGLGLLGLGLLMVSDIPYFSGKGVTVRRTNRVVVLTVIGFVLVLAKPSVTLFLIGVVYTASGPFEMWRRKRKGIALEEVEDTDEGEEASA